MSDTRVVCPHCSAINTLPTGRLGDGPRCGRCKEAVFNANPVELTAATFDRHVARNDIPLLVDFWAPWCGPCRAMAPAFEEAAAKLEPNVRVAKLNTEEEQMTGARYGIRSIPTMILFSGGQEVARQSGAMMAPQIIAWVQSNL
jgi:thioredoxin 2